jgi:hypothetical protein
MWGVWLDVGRPPRDAAEYDQVLGGAWWPRMGVCSARMDGARVQSGWSRLKGFRTALYGCATRRADAWFELVDALLATERLVSLPHLSLEPVHRRGHGSLYAALRRGQVQAERLREVLAAHLPAGPPVFAVDPTVWPRCDAECSPGRGFYCHPWRHSAGQPIVAGWCYQLIVGLELARNSWTAPVECAPAGT